jgi:regulator of sigma E protease
VNGPDGAPAAAPPAPPGDAPPLGPIEWIRVNGPLLLLLAAGVAWLVAKTGPVGLWKLFLVVIGIGFVIFVHELGHFVAAKLCDVHVTTFSIGFGPAIPGLSFRRAETLYKVALLPLGGYVNMVGEGPEADEDESYPRSFKNKPVGQRMFIISAGVVMNVLLGCVCFVLVYRFHGERRPPAIVGYVQPGTPAWKAGVQSAMRIDDVNGRKNPFWDTLNIEVASAPAGRAIPFVFEATDRRKLEVELTPRLDPGDEKPVIGVGLAQRARLQNARYFAGSGHPPYALQTPAAAARVVDLRPGDVLVAATDPARGGAVTPLPAEPRPALAELARRMRDPALADKPLTVRVRNGKASDPVDMTVPPGGFAYEDQVVATTDPTAADPLVVKELPPDPFPDPALKNSPDEPRDFFEYQDRMKQMADRPALVRVRRKAAPDAAEGEQTLLVPPAYHHTLGLRMTLGRVAAVRSGSPAEKAGVQEGDQLTRVVLTTSAGRTEFRAGDVDPVRLPSLLADAAAKGSGPKRVELTVLRPDKRNEEKQLAAVDWDDAWDFAEEPAWVPRSPLSVPQLGLAYLIQATVTAVVPDNPGAAGAVAGGPAARSLAQTSPGAAAGARPGDTVLEIRFRQLPEKKGAAAEWGDWVSLQDKARFDPGDASEQWAYIETALQSRDNYEVQLKVRGSDGKVVYLPGRTEAAPAEGLTAVEDPTWPLAERGLIFEADVWLQKTDSTVQALSYGVERTGEFIRQIILNLRALVTGRISVKSSAAGPLRIAPMVFAAAGDPFDLLLTLGLISVNLAVANFLPIPVLDGGHMVFLIYEKLRGRPPSPAVQNAATILGIVLLVALMLYITFQDAGSLGLFRWAKQLVAR